MKSFLTIFCNVKIFCLLFLSQVMLLILIKELIPPSLNHANKIGCPNTIQEKTTTKNILSLTDWPYRKNGRVTSGVNYVNIILDIVNFTSL